MAKKGWKQADGRVTSVDSIATRGRRQLTVGFTYEVAGHAYEGKFYTFDSIHQGAPLIVEYEISNPKHNNFENRQSRINRIAFVGALLVVAVALILLSFSLQR